MTKETLAFARGESKLWVRKVYLYKFFEEVADQLRRELSDRGIQLELELLDRGTAYFDEQKMMRVLHNLARNAAEAIGERGGVCTLSVDRREEGALEIRFADNGPGIAEEMRERLFDSFTTHGKQEGTGLGLAIVRRIVQDHDGTIEVDSVPGRTVFTILIPQPEDAVRHPTTPPPPPPDRPSDAGGSLH